MIDWGRRDEGERLGRSTHRLIEPGEQFGSKARGKRRARLVEKRADTLETKPPQRDADVRGEPQRLNRQSSECISFLLGWQQTDRTGMETRQGPGHAGSCGD